MKMMIVEPETFDDSQNIADYLRERKPVVINFENTAADVSKRVVDFISGATYALDGEYPKSRQGYLPVCAQQCSCRPW